MSQQKPTCAMCGRVLPPMSYDLCPNCAREQGVVGLPRSMYKPALLALIKDHKREAYRELCDREVLACDNPEVDKLFNGELGAEYGEGETAYDYRYCDGLKSVEPTSDGTLLCAVCGGEWSDKCRTFPLEINQWEQPVCPECGRIIYTSTDGEHIEMANSLGAMTEEQKEAASDLTEKWMKIEGGRVKGASGCTVAVLSGERPLAELHHWSLREVWSRGPAQSWRAEINERIRGQRRRYGFSGTGADRGIPGAIFSPRTLLPRGRAGAIIRRSSEASGV